MVNDVISPETLAKQLIWRQEYLPIWDAKKAPMELSVTGLRDLSGLTAEVRDGKAIQLSSLLGFAK